MAFKKIWTLLFIVNISWGLQAQESSEIWQVESIVRAASFLEMIHAKLEQLTLTITTCAPGERKDKQIQKVTCSLQTELLQAGLRNIMTFIAQHKDLTHEIGLQETMDALNRELQRLMMLNNPPECNREKRLSMANEQVIQLQETTAMVADAVRSTWQLVPLDTNRLEGLLTRESNQRFELAKKGAQLAEKRLEELNAIIYQHQLTMAEAKHQLSALRLNELKAGSSGTPLYQIYPAAPSTWHCAPTAPQLPF